MPCWANRRPGTGKRVRVARFPSTVWELRVVFGARTVTDRSAIDRSFDPTNLIASRICVRFCLEGACRTPTFKFFGGWVRLQWTIARGRRSRIVGRCDFGGPVWRVVSESSRHLDRGYENEERHCGTPPECVAPGLALPSEHRRTVRPAVTNPANGSCRNRWHGDPRRSSTDTIHPFVGRHAKSAAIRNGRTWRTG